MFRMSKMMGLFLIGFCLVVCTVSSNAQQGKDEEKKQDKGKFPGGGGGGAGMRGRMAQPGKIFSSYVISQLKLTDEQTKQLEVIQKEVDEKLDKMLTDDQKAKLKELATARPGGGGGFPGGGGRPMPKKDAPKDTPKDAPKDEKKDEKKDQKKDN
jgi:hypothetical protein